MQTAAVVRQITKIVVVGDARTGKTSLCNRHVYGKFDDEYQGTIGVDNWALPIIENPAQRRESKVDIWDAAGHERFRALVPAYIKDSHAVIICFDLSNRASFASVPSWVETASAAHGAAILLVGTKSDVTNRAVSTEEAAVKAASYDIPFFETSSKHSINVNLIFERVLQEIETRQRPPSVLSLVIGFEPIRVVEPRAKIHAVSPLTKKSTASKTHYPIVTLKSDIVVNNDKLLKTVAKVVALPSPSKLALKQSMAPATIDTTPIVKSASSSAISINMPTTTTQQPKPSSSSSSLRKTVSSDDDNNVPALALQPAEPPVESCCFLPALTALKSFIRIF